MQARRATCARCLRAQSACICQWITPLASSVELLILQHPLEVGNAKNSARLLHLSVQPSVMVVGETFDAGALAGLLEEGGRTPVLLYPDTPGVVSLPLDVTEPGTLRLVIVDATWRKSRKMLYLNPLLQSLPRLTLRAMPTSHYRIRKAHAPDQLSTLEAAAYALMQVDAAPARWQGLIAAFDGFVGQQMGFVPDAPLE
ncbi:MAG: DTW domain-containing protein [Pseudomonadota bacterium]|nr:DTW domain-containing protein [Pseudomonadota bacterium]